MWTQEYPRRYENIVQKITVHVRCDVWVPCYSFTIHLPFLCVHLIRLFVIHLTPARLCEYGCVVVCVCNASLHYDTLDISNLRAICARVARLLSANFLNWKHLPYNNKVSLFSFPLTFDLWECSNKNKTYIKCMMCNFPCWIHFIRLCTNFEPQMPDENDSKREK